MKHIISKQFSFCYGHRVWNQLLDTEYTHNNDGCLSCRHIHGHEGVVTIFVEEYENGTNMHDSGMVLDFKMLGFMKTFIDNELDHKFIMDMNDPLFTEEFPYTNHPSKMIKQAEGHYVPDLQYVRSLVSTFEHLEGNLLTQDAIVEKYEGAVFVDFIPTSENLATWMLEVATKKLERVNVHVSAVEYKETPKSHCRVEAPQPTGES